MYTLTKLKHGFTVNFSASFEGIDSVCLDIKQFMSENGFDSSSFDTLLGVREALTNAVLHGSKMDSNRDVSFSIEADAKRLLIRVTDSGSGFDWREAEKKVALSTDTHGRGIRILGQYFDSYRFNEIGNEVELVKNIK
ncbi:MAG: ATP-binding protein [SAR324 cluster bacterium]|nr:ATP-binding protein [SAR324 cluster bacterium]